MNSSNTNEHHPQHQKEVVIVAMTSQVLLDFTGPTDVFSAANRFIQSSGSGDGYSISVVAPTADKTLSSGNGVKVTCEACAMDILRPIDTLIVAGNDRWNADDDSLHSFYNWLSTISEHNTRRIASVCAGAFSLAKVGLLNHKKATTHWELSEELKKRYPLIDVNANEFFTRDGAIYTSAGVSSGIDLSLALVEEDFGRDLAIKVARHLVFYLNRPGFQAQFGNLLPIYESTNIGQKLQVWLSDQLHKPLDVGTIAEHFNMSARNLTRIVQKQMGMPPAKFIEKLRVEKARKYLEDTDLPLERVVEKCGLGNLVSMRRIFIRHLMTTPSDYRRNFRSAVNFIEAEELLSKS